MGQSHHSTPKHRLQLSALLLLLVGLCSIGSPSHLKRAHLVHRSPASASRATSQINRARLGGSRTSVDAEAEPETSAVLTSASTTSAHQTPAQPQTLTACITPAPLPERIVSISCIEQDSPSIPTNLSALPHLGRAPPVA
jgi:hypothetical protein